MSSGKVLLGFLAGMASGALMGILFAPEKGSVTRSKISKKSKESVEGLKEKFNDFVDNIAEHFESSKSEAKDLYREGKSQAENVAKDIKSTFS